MSKKYQQSSPTFLRSEAARILNIAPLTIANREKRNQYPDPKRDLNGYRIYSLNDILNLQLITYNKIDTRPIMSVLYDKGYRDVKTIGQIIDEAMSRRGLGKS